MPRSDSSIAEDPEAESRPTDPGDWHRLRSLLFGRERASLDALAAKVGDGESLARSVAGVLSEAVAIRTRRDDDLTRALGPLMEDSLQHSVRKNPQPLVDALYPIMGPAIRRSITEALAELIQLFNAAVEQSLSPRALKWRFDAWRTGQSYASVVLLKTLVYRVEQVFLIHRNSGLLLRHVVADQVVAQDPDMVSAMLTAIRDFVSDSFQVSREDSVNSIRLGQFSVQLRVGPNAVLAVVVRGSAPESLQTRLSETLEDIHRNYVKALSEFDGDPAAFANVEPLLRPCLSAQSRPAKPYSSWHAYLPLGLIVIALGGWVYARHQASAGWNEILAELTREPGLVVLDVGNAEPRSLHGLRDPLARDPLAIVGPRRMRQYNIVWDWKPYLSTEPQLVLTRAQRLLRPPAGLTLRVDRDTLLASGSASASWLRDARSRAPLIPGVGVFDDSAVVPDDQRTFDHARQILTAVALYFEPGSYSLSDVERARLATLSSQLSALRDSAAALHIGYLVEVVGRADAPGTTAINLRLSKNRADVVRDALIAHGLSAQRVHARGIGAIDPSSGVSDTASAAVEKQFLSVDRRVNLVVTVKPSDPSDAAQ